MQCVSDVKAPSVLLGACIFFFQEREPIRKQSLWQYIILCIFYRALLLLLPLQLPHKPIFIMMKSTTSSSKMMIRKRGLKPIAVAAVLVAVQTTTPSSSSSLLLGGGGAPRRRRLSICFAGEPRTVNVLSFRGAVFFDFNEWRCLLCELSGVAARHFLHDASEDELWKELALAEKPPPHGELTRLLSSRRAGRYVDRHFLSQVVFALEPTREGCAMIFALSQIEIYCVQKRDDPQHHHSSSPPSTPEALHWLDIVPASGVKQEEDKKKDDNAHSSS
jgi:hypothetical protein